MEKLLDKKRLNRQKTVLNVWDPGLDPGPEKKMAGVQKWVKFDCR